MGRKRKREWHVGAGVFLVLCCTGLPLMGLSMGSASPNPVRFQTSASVTRITVRVPSDGAACSAEIRIVDMAGREVIRSQRSEYLTSDYTFDWDGKNSAGRMVRSGIYIVYVYRRFQDVSRNGESERFRLGVLRDGL